MLKKKAHTGAMCDGVVCHAYAMCERNGMKWHQEEQGDNATGF